MFHHYIKQVACHFYILSNSNMFPVFVRIWAIHNIVFKACYLQMYLLTFANVPVFICFPDRNINVFRVFKQACFLLSIIIKKFMEETYYGNVRFY